MELLEKNILEHLRKGEVSAFEYVFRTYYSGLLRYASQILKNDDWAEETVEQTFLKLWERHGELEIETSIRSYLFKSVYNHCLNYLKHKYIEERHLLYLRHHMSEEDAMADSFHPLARLLKSDVEDILHHAVTQLPHQCREVFMLSRYQNLANEEISRKLGISVNTVRTQISRALVRLREDLKDYLQL